MKLWMHGTVALLTVGGSSLFEPEVRGFSGEESLALIELLSNSMSKTMKHKNRRRAEPHIECEQGPDDGDTNDPECHAARVQLLYDLVDEHGTRSLKRYTDVNTKGSELLTRSSELASQLDELTTGVAKNATSGLVESGRQLIKGTQGLREGLVLVGDHLWSDLITVNNITNMDMQVIKNSTLNSLGELVNSSQSILNEEARIHHALMSRIIGRVNKKIDDIATDLNKYQLKLDEQLVLYGVEGGKRTEELQKMAETISRKFEGLFNIISESPEKTAELLRHFKTQLDDQLEKDEQHSKVDVREKVEVLTNSMNAKMTVFEKASEDAISSVSGDFQSLLKQKEQTRVDEAARLQSLSKMTEEEIKHLAEYSLDRAGKLVMSADERMKRLFDNIKKISITTAGKTGDAARKAAEELGRLVVDGPEGFDRALTSRNSDLRKNLKQLVTGASSASAEQLMELMNSLGMVAEGIADGNGDAKKEVRAIMENLETVISRKVKGQAIVNSDQEGAILTLSSTLNAELEASTSAAERSLSGDGQALLEATLQQAAGMEHAMRQIEQQEIRTKADMEKAVAAGDFGLQVQLGDNQKKLKEHKLQTETKMRAIAGQLNQQGAVAGSAASSLKDALEKAGASQEEMRKLLSTDGNSQVALELATRLAAGDTRILRKLERLVADAKKEADTNVKKDVSAIRNGMREILGKARIDIAEIGVKDDIDRKQLDLQATILTLSPGDDTLVENLYKEQSQLRAKTDKLFVADMMEKRGQTEEKLGLMMEKVLDKQSQVGSHVKDAFLSELRDMAVDGDKDQVNKLLTEIKSMEWTLFDVKNVSIADMASITDMFAVEGFRKMAELEQQLGTNMKNVTDRVDAILPEMNHLNSTVTQSISDSLAKLSERLGGLEKNMQWKKRALIRQMYGDGLTSSKQELAEVIMANSSSAAAQKQALERLRSLNEMDDLVKGLRSDEKSQALITQVELEIVDGDDQLINSDLRDLVNKVKHIDAEERKNTSSIQDNIERVLIEASATLGTMNETVQTAVQSFKSQLDAGKANTDFSLDVASVQASKLVDYAQRVEKEGVEAQQALQTYWEDAANNTKNDARAIKESIQQGRQSTQDRLSRVFDELGNTENSAADTIQAEGRELEIHLAVIRRLVNGLIGIWTEFATAAETKNKFFGNKNKEFLMTLERQVDDQKDRVNADIKRAMYQATSAIAFVDQAWLRENQFQLNMVRDQEFANQQAQQMKNDQVAIMKDFVAQMDTFENAEIQQEADFKKSMTDMLGSFEQRVEGKFQQLLDTLKT